MDGDDLVEFRKRIVFHGNDGTVMPGIVDQDVDPAEFFAGGGNDMSARGLLRQIRGGVFRPAATLCYFLPDGGEFFFSARREKHCRAFFRE